MVNISLAYLVTMDVLPTWGSPRRTILNCRSATSSSESDMISVLFWLERTERDTTADEGSS